MAQTIDPRRYGGAPPGAGAPLAQPRPDRPVLPPPPQMGLAELARRVQPIPSQAILGGRQPMMAPPMTDMGQGQYQQALDALRQLYRGGQ